MTENLRIELRFKNNVLWEALVSVANGGTRGAGNSGKANVIGTASDMLGIKRSVLSSYLTLKCHPLNRHGQWKPSAAEMAAKLDMTPEELFPLELYNGAFGKTLVRAVDSARFVPLHLGARVAAIQSADGALIANEHRRRVLAAVESVPGSGWGTGLSAPELLKRRFGLDGYEEHTLEQIADEFGLTKERIRQIESKALRQMRHPSISRELKDLSGGIQHNEYE